MSEQSIEPRRRSDARLWWKTIRRNGVLLYVVLIAIALIYIMPFIIQVSTSFKTDADASANPVSLVPQVWTSAAYSRLFLHSDFPLWFKNSLIVTIFVTIGRVFFDSLAGYALARLRFPGRNLIYLTLVAVMSVPGVALMIPKFWLSRVWAFTTPMQA